MMDKLKSGRYILTVACALVFVFCSVTKRLEVDTVAMILVMVFTLYFTRDRNGTPKV